MGALRDQHDDDGRADSCARDAAALRDLIREVQATAPLTPAEEQALLERSALGDKGSQERLVAAHLSLVIELAAARGPQPLSAPDPVQEGSIGLVEAVRSFGDRGARDFGPSERRTLCRRGDA